MTQARTIHILGLGAVTSVGATAAVAMAAAQAELSRMMLVPDDDAENATNVARIAALSLGSPAARAQEFLRLAAAQALAPAIGITARTLGGWSAGPPLFDASVLVSKVAATRLRGVSARMETVGGHGSSALLALQKAVSTLAQDGVDLALVTAVDVRTDEAAVAAAVKAGRAIGPSRQFGYVPGEGAAAVLLATEPWAQRSGLRSLGTVSAVALGQEPNPWGSAQPCVGRGLTDAVRGALSMVPPEQKVARVVCDLNGERHRADEWGFTACRVAGRLRDPSAFVAPTIAWGDCGAANGLLLLALATAMAAREATAGAYSLIWTSSDGPERAAAILRSADPAPGAYRDAVASRAQGAAGQSAPVQSAPAQSAALQAAPPRWARALDGEILACMIDELRFRFEQREYLLSEIDLGDEPPPDYAGVERVEDGMAALATGLAESGAQALQMSEEAANPQSPGTVYTAARVLLEAGEARRAVALAKTQIAANAAVEPTVVQAFAHTLSAFVHARRPASATEDWWKLLWESGDPLAWVTLELAGLSGVSAGAVPWRALARALPPERAPTFLTALGRIGVPEFAPALARYEAAPNPRVRREAALAEVLLTGAAARPSLLARARTDADVLLPLSLVVDAAHADPLLTIAKAAKSKEACLAVAIGGDAAAVPWLLDWLADNPATAKQAAAALEILLGRSCFEEHEVPDLIPDAPPRKVRRVCARRAAWEPIAKRVLGVHPKHLRLCAGRPATLASIATLLGRPHLPPLARRYLGLELVVRWGAPRAFDASLPIQAQRRWLALAETRAERLPPGSWGIAKSEDLRGRGSGGT